MTFKEYSKNNKSSLNVQDMYLGSIGLTDLYGIEIFKNLNFLDVSDNLICDFTPLIGLSSLYMIDFHNNKEYYGIGKLKHISTVHTGKEWLHIQKEVDEFLKPFKRKEKINFLLK